MEVLYRFCWEADEISDGPGPAGEKKRKLARFRKNLGRTFQNKAREPLFQRLRGVIARFGLSREPLERILKGVEQDLKPLRFDRFPQLHQYALRVAGGPGLSSMEIFGFKDRAHRDYAQNLGVFLQIVNMARDYQEDTSLGRQYFPTEDFRRFHLSPGNIEEGNSHWKPFMEFQLARAWGFLESSRKSLTSAQRAEIPTAEAIAAVYVKLHQKLRANPGRILKGKTVLSKADKLVSVLGAVGKCLLWRWGKGSG